VQRCGHPGPPPGRLRTAPGTPRCAPPPRPPAGIPWAHPPLATPQAALPPPPGPLCREAGPPMGAARPTPLAAVFLLLLEPTIPLPTCTGCTLMAVSDTRMRDGVQRSRPGPLVSFSMASFSTSIPEERESPSRRPLPQLWAGCSQGAASQPHKQGLPGAGAWLLSCPTAGGSQAPPAAAGPVALTHSPGHGQAAYVQRLIGLHRLPHRFQYIHCQDRRGEGNPPVSPCCTPSSPRSQGTQPGRPKVSGCWASCCPRVDWAGGAAGSARGTVPCSGRSSVDAGSNVAVHGSPLLATACSAMICKRWGPSASPHP